MKYLYTFALCLFAIACNSSKTPTPESSIQAIKTLEANASLSKSDTLINSYINFANQFPQHKLAPVFMFKAAHAYVASNKSLKGVKLYEKLADTYQNDSLAPEAMICAAVGFQGLQDPANAKRLFDRFVQRYPQHPRVEEVKKMGEYVGMSEEALLELFQKQHLQEKDSIKLQ